MNKIFLVPILLFASFPFSVVAQKSLPLIPKPREISFQAGNYSLHQPVKVAAYEEFAKVAKLLKEHPSIAFEEIEIIKKKKKIPPTGIRLIKAEAADKHPKDTYRMEIGEDGIKIVADTEEVMINAIMTLVQIGHLHKDKLSLPFLKMEDAPQFRRRGLHLDTSSHFYPVFSLERYIDLMALYKYNTFYWQLSDAAGWRLEVKSYPELTTKAAWRNYASWKNWSNSSGRFVEMGHSNASGGFYSQDEARHIVEYAARKGITVVPEFTLARNSDAILAVYPQLSCSGIPYSSSELCVGNEESFTFLNKVLSEVTTIFPISDIRIGGEKSSKVAWSTCPKCQKRMKDENLKTVDALDEYTIKRIATFLKSNEDRLLTVKDIHSLISFDTFQSNPLDEPEAIDGFTPLSAVYAFNPASIKTKRAPENSVEGIEATVSTKYMTNFNEVEYMVFPRALALSEVAWSADKSRDWADFEERLQSHYLVLQRLKVNYYRPSYMPNIQARYDDKLKASLISISSEQYKPIIRYTTDGSTPNARSPQYVEPVELFKSAKVKAAAFADSTRLGAVDSLQVDIHRAIGKKIIYNNPVDKYKGKGDSTLIDGIKGGFILDDGEWLGFSKLGLDVTIDFERREELKSVSIRFVQKSQAKVFLPGSVSIEVSDNGKNFKEIKKLESRSPNIQSAILYRDFKFDMEGKMARFVRVKATNPKKGHLLTDEIIIY